MMIEFRTSGIEMRRLYIFVLAIGMIILLCGCAVLAQRPSVEEGKSELFIAVAKAFYREDLMRPGLIARISVDGRDPPRNLLARINSGSVGFFVADSDFLASRKANNFREMHFGAVERCDDGWYVWVTIAWVPSGGTLYRFRVKPTKDGLVVTTD